MTKSSTSSVPNQMDNSSPPERDSSLPRSKPLDSCVGFVAMMHAITGSIRDVNDKLMEDIGRKVWTESEKAKSMERRAASMKSECNSGLEALEWIHGIVPEKLFKKIEFHLNDISKNSAYLEKQLSTVSGSMEESVQAAMQSYLDIITENVQWLKKMLDASGEGCCEENDDDEDQEVKTGEELIDQDPIPENHHAPDFDSTSDQFGHPSDATLEDAPPQMTLPLSAVRDSPVDPEISPVPQDPDHPAGNTDQFGFVAALETTGGSLDSDLVFEKNAVTSEPNVEKFALPASPTVLETSGGSLNSDPVFEDVVVTSGPHHEELALPASPTVLDTSEMTVNSNVVYEESAVAKETSLGAPTSPALLDSSGDSDDNEPAPENTAVTSEPSPQNVAPAASPTVLDISEKDDDNNVVYEKSAVTYDADLEAPSSPTLLDTFGDSDDSEPVPKNTVVTSEPNAEKVAPAAITLIEPSERSVFNNVIHEESSAVASDPVFEDVVVTSEPHHEELALPASSTVLETSERADDNNVVHEESAVTKETDLGAPTSSAFLDSSEDSDDSEPVPRNTVVTSEPNHEEFAFPASPTGLDTSERTDDINVVHEEPAVANESDLGDSISTAFPLGNRPNSVSESRKEDSDSSVSSKDSPRHNASKVSRARQSPKDLEFYADQGGQDFKDIQSSSSNCKTDVPAEDNQAPCQNGSEIPKPPHSSTEQLDLESVPDLGTPDVQNDDDDIGDAQDPASPFSMNDPTDDQSVPAALPVGKSSASTLDSTRGIVRKSKVRRSSAPRKEPSPGCSSSVVPMGQHVNQERPPVIQSFDATVVPEEELAKMMALHPISIARNFLTQYPLDGGLFSREKLYENGTIGQRDILKSQPGQTVAFNTNDYVKFPMFTQLYRALNNLPAGFRLGSDDQFFEPPTRFSKNANRVRIDYASAKSQISVDFKFAGMHTVLVNVGSGSCTGFSVDPKYSKKLIDEYGSKIYSSGFRLKHEDLVKKKIPVQKFIQHPGDLVFIQPIVYFGIEANGDTTLVSYNVAPYTQVQLDGMLFMYNHARSCGIPDVYPVPRMLWALAEQQVLGPDHDNGLFSRTVVSALKDFLRIDEEDYDKRGNKKVIKWSRCVEEEICNKCGLSITNVHVIASKKQYHMGCRTGIPSDQQTLNCKRSLKTEKRILKNYIDPVEEVRTGGNFLEDVQIEKPAPKKKNLKKRGYARSFSDLWQKKRNTATARKARNGEGTSGSSELRRGTKRRRVTGFEDIDAQTPCSSGSSKKPKTDGNQFEADQELDDPQLPGTSQQRTSPPKKKKKLNASWIESNGFADSDEEEEESDSA